MSIIKKTREERVKAIYDALYHEVSTETIENLINLVSLNALSIDENLNKFILFQQQILNNISMSNVAETVEEKEVIIMMMKEAYMKLGVELSEINLLVNEIEDVQKQADEMISNYLNKLGGEYE